MSEYIELPLLIDLIIEKQGWPSRYMNINWDTFKHSAALRLRHNLNYQTVDLISECLARLLESMLPPKDLIRREKEINYLRIK